MYSVLTIADEILKHAKRLERTLTPMQLNKIAYISQGASLAMLQRPMFSDRIEAWKYGPVIPTLYQATKKYGRAEIPANLIDKDSPDALDNDTQALLKEVVEKYSHLTGIQLSSSTHRPGTPWYQVYEPDVMGKEIPTHIIREHYLKELDEYRQRISATSS